MELERTPVLCCRHPWAKAGGCWASWAWRCCWGWGWRAPRGVRWEEKVTHAWMARMVHGTNLYVYIYIYYRERERAVWSWPCWIWQRSMLNGAIEIQLDTKTLGRSGIKKGWGMQPKSKINETHMKQSIHRFLTCGWLVMVGLLHIVSNGCLGKLLNGQFTVRSVLVNEWPVLTRIWWGNIQPVLQHMFYSLVHQISVGFRWKWKVLPKNWDFIPISSQDTNPFKSFQNLSGKVMLETLEVGSFSVSSKRMIGVKLVGRKPPSKGW